MPAATVIGTRKPGDVAAEDDRQHSPTLEPRLGEGEARRRQVGEPGEPVLQDAAPDDARHQIEVCRAQHDNADQAQPGREPERKRKRHVYADVYDEHVARRRQGDSRLLEVEQGERTQMALAADRILHPAHSVGEEFDVRHVSEAALRRAPPATAAWLHHIDHGLTSNRLWGLRLRHPVMVFYGQLTLLRRLPGRPSR